MWSDDTTMFFPNNTDKEVIKFKLFASHPYVLYQLETHLILRSIAKHVDSRVTKIDIADVVDFAIVEDRYLFLLRHSSLDIYEFTIAEKGVSVAQICQENLFDFSAYKNIAVDPANHRLFYLHGGSSVSAMACTFDGREIDGILLNFNSRLITFIPGTDYIAHLRTDAYNPNGPPWVAVTLIANRGISHQQRCYPFLGLQFAYIQCVSTPTGAVVAVLACDTEGLNASRMLYLAQSRDDNTGRTWITWVDNVPDPDFRALVPGPANVLNALKIGRTPADNDLDSKPARIAQYDIVKKSLFIDSRRMHVDDGDVEKLVQFIQIRAM